MWDKRIKNDMKVEDKGGRRCRKYVIRSGGGRRDRSKKKGQTVFETPEAMILSTTTIMAIRRRSQEDTYANGKLNNKNSITVEFSDTEVQCFEVRLLAATKNHRT
eukprot:108578-Hanusia_phi.AAC.5